MAHSSTFELRLSFLGERAQSLHPVLRRDHLQQQARIAEASARQCSAKMNLQLRQAATGTCA